MVALTMISFKDKYTSMDFNFPDLSQLEDKTELKNHKRVSYYKKQNGYISKKGINDLQVYASRINGSKENSLGNNNIIELMPMVENKYPFAMLKSEALKEADTSLNYIQKYYSEFNELPPIPLPLALEDIKKDFQQDTIDILKKHVSQKVVEKIETILSNDQLCVLYSFYNSLPIRVMDISTQPKEAQIFWNSKTVNMVINRWCKEIARMLFLGYSPATKWSLVTGHCLSPQNLCLSGGIADLDSLTELQSIKNDMMIIESIAYSLSEFTNSVFIALEYSTSNTSSKNERRFMLRNYLFEEIKIELNNINKAPSELIKDFFAHRNHYFDLLS